MSDIALAVGQVWTPTKGKSTIGRHIFKMSDAGFGGRIWYHTTNNKKTVWSYCGCFRAGIAKTGAVMKEAT